MNCFTPRPGIMIVSTVTLLFVGTFLVKAQEQAPAHTERRANSRAYVAGTDATLRATVNTGSALRTGVTFRLVPVNPPPQAPPYPPGTVVDEANASITVPGGPARRIWMEPRFSNWGCCLGGTFLVFQGQLGPASVLPAGVRVPNQSCSTEADCVVAGMSQCSAVCDPGFYDVNNPLTTDPNIVSLNGSRIACGWTYITGTSPSDTGNEAYGCTFVLEVEPGVVGTIQVPFQNPDVDTFLLSGAGSNYPIVQLIPATIEVLGGEFCCSMGACSFVAAPGTCAGLGLTPASGPCLGDCDNNGINDACQGMSDCNGNGIGDYCDVASGFSADCNRNFTPDECEDQTDCDNNGVQDICDVFDREANDCNFNNIPDACDLADGTEPDNDGNGVIDFCELRSRFVFFDAPAGEVAIRIKFLNLDGFESFNGDVRWAQPAGQFVNGMFGGMFWAAQVGCDPVLTTWPEGERLHVHGASIVPSSDYEIRFADAACLAMGVESCMTPPIVESTSFWADIRSPYLGHGSTSQPNAADINAVVQTFIGSPLAIHYTRARLAGNTMSLTQAISFQDIRALVDSVEGKPYPNSGPVSCP